MQTALSRTWTWVTNFISYDNNYNSMHTTICEGLWGANLTFRLAQLAGAV